LEQGLAVSGLAHRNNYENFGEPRTELHSKVLEDRYTVDQNLVF